MNEEPQGEAMPMTDDEIDRKLAQIAKSRADAQAKIAKQAKLRRLIDTEEIAKLEAQYGATNVAVKEVAFHSPDMPVLFAVRTPTPAMVKNYRAGVEPDENGNRDVYTPSEDLGIQSLIYPDRETFLRMRELRYGIGTQAGLTALGLATSREEQRGKA